MIPTPVPLPFWQQIFWLCMWGLVVFGQLGFAIYVSLFH